jgi:twinkle protein
MNLLHDQEFLEFQGVEESSRLTQFKDIQEDIWERLKQGPEQYGDKLPWPKTFETFRFRPGETTLWAGVNGHGKSLAAGMAVLWFPYEVKSVIASLEMPISATAARMCRQSIIGGNPSKHYVKLFAEATDNIWVYDENRTVQPNRILALCMYAGGKLKANHVIIDSLVKCGMKSHDNLDQQKDFIDALCQTAKAYNIHIHLVHHMRKGEKEGKMPDKFDIKGAGEITDLVDNILIAHRNKNKERKADAGEHVEEMEPDTRLLCVKQRHGEWEGIINLWFDKPTQQFMGGLNSRLRWRIG